MNRTKIEWCDFSWNPITGCKHGCWYCYANKLAKRFKNIFPKGFEPTFYPERLHEPWLYKKPSKIFVCSVSDLFAPWIPTEWRNNVLSSIFTSPVKHTFILLTKNPENIPSIEFPENVWIGTTVSTQRETWRITMLKEKAFCKTLFVSFEPLLGEVHPNLEGISWIIIGKLTGSKRIKLQTEWVDNLIAHAFWLNIPIFMKDNLKPEYKGKYWLREFPRGKEQ